MKSELSWGICQSVEKEGMGRRKDAVIRCHEWCGQLTMLETGLSSLSPTNQA